MALYVSFVPNLSPIVTSPSRFPHVAFSSITSFLSAVSVRPLRRNRLIRPCRTVHTTCNSAKNGHDISDDRRLIPELDASATEIQPPRSFPHSSGNGIPTSLRAHLPHSSNPHFATKEYSQTHKYNLVRPIASIVAMAVGFIIFPLIEYIITPFSTAMNIEQLDVLITGTFTPVVGILFAMLASTAVSSLRQRQQDLRDLLNQELALIRMLLVMIKDRSIIQLLLQYTLLLESETFGHRENGISYEHEKPGTDQAIRREEVFAESEETLWQCVQEANDLRLRSEVEATIRNLVVFRTKRRAVLDSGLPEIHFIITGLLGVCMMAAFCLVSSADLRLFKLTTARLLFGGLLSLLSLTYTLLKDLRDPFGGDYGVAPWRLYRTVELLRNRLGIEMP